MRLRTPALAAAFAMMTAGCGDDGEGPQAPAGPTEYTGTVSLVSWCDVSPSPCCNNCPGSPSLELMITGADPAVAGDGMLTIVIAGDLDDPVDEFLSVSVEGYNLGIVFNDDPGDDAFDLATDHTDDCTPSTLNAVIPQAQLELIAADGVVEITLTPGQVNNDIEDVGCPDPDVETIAVTIRYGVS